MSIVKIYSQIVVQYLYGKEVDRDYEKAVVYLTSAVEHGNQYAAQLLHSMKSNGNWSAAMGAIRLLHHISRMILGRMEDERKGRISAYTARRNHPDRRN